MKIELDLNLLEKYKLTPNQYVYCYLLLKTGEEPYLNNSEYSMLIDNEYIEIQYTDKTMFGIPKVTNKFKKDFLKSPHTDVVEWIEKYRDLFPKGIYSGGYLVRGDRKGCIKKMKTFMNKYPEFADKDLILKATKNYIDDKQKDNYSYLKLAHYFIDKDGISLLASYCEAIISQSKAEVNSNNIINL